MRAQRKDTILVIDDQRANIDVLVGLLQSDYELYVALDGDTGLRLLAEVNPDLVLLDVNMPGMNGFDVCVKIKQSPEHRDTPVIFLTAQCTAADEVHGLSMGASDFIAKPFNPELVKARVKTQMTIATAQYFRVQAAQHEALRSIVASMAHELNTPIGNTLTTSSFLSNTVADFQINPLVEQVASPELGRFLSLSLETSNLILRNVSKAADLITALQTVVLTQDDAERTRINVHAQLSDFILHFRGNLEAKNIVATLDCPADLSVFAAPEAFSQLFRYLFLNSIKHGFTGKVPGEIRIIVALTQDHNLDIQFSHNGKGYQADAIGSLFDPFGNHIDAFSDSELGTFIAYNLVSRNLGGTIEAHSRDGRGLYCHIRIPLGS